jgi:predicted metal-dependent hydrolase
MFIVDDPLLALILRFVVNTDKASKANEAFLQRQLRTIKQYLAQFPAEEHGARAMEWIEQHAETYRQSWQRRTVSSGTVALRCKDCPLKRIGASEHCEIHEQWLYLLRQYIAGRATSAGYVEESLSLLRQYKDELALRVPRKQKSAEKSEKKKKKGKKKDRAKEARGTGAEGR